MIAAYLRVSTDEQAERGTIELQRQEIASWAERRGTAVTYFEDPGWSGTLPLDQRPGASAMLRALLAGLISAIVVWKLDRLARDPAIVLPFVRRLESRGVALHSVTESFDITTPAGELTSTITAAAARYERQLIIERSIAGSRRVAREEGRWLGGIVPFGYRKRADGILAIDEAPMPGLALSEADVVREIFRRCAEDGWSTKRIAADLQDRHVPTAYVRDARTFLAGEILGTHAPKEGKRRRLTQGTWRSGAVLRILHAPIYRGEHVYEARGRHGSVTRAMPALVSPALWQRAQLQLQANDHWKNRGARRAYLLRGLLTCSCGHRLVGQAWPTRGGESRVYGCVAHPEGKGSRVRAEVIEPLLWADVVAFFERPSEVVETIIRGQAPAGRREDRAERELLAATSRKAELEGIESRLIDLFASTAALSPALLERKLADARTELAELDRHIATLRDARAHAARQEAEAETVTRLLGRLRQRARDASDTTRQRILRVLLGSCVVSGSHVRAVFRFGSEYDFAAMPHTDVPAGIAATRSSSAPACRTR